MSMDVEKLLTEFNILHAKKKTLESQKEESQILVIHDEHTELY